MGRPLFNVIQGGFYRLVLSRRWATFLVLGLAFFVFGAGTANLFVLFRRNVELVGEYGWQALMDGALQQFMELLVTGYLSVLAYLVFKACETRLVRDLVSPPVPGPPTPDR
jgi:hypothetical protein